MFMKKIFLLLIIALYSCSSNTKIEGTYKYSSCGDALNCNYFEFFENGTYRYNVILYTSQHKCFNGSWSHKNDTIFLKPYAYITPDSTRIEIRDCNDDSKTEISINMLGSYEQGQKPDTLRTQWYVSLDNGVNYISTDTLGKLSVNKQYIQKIKIQDIMQHTNNFKLFANKDSIFNVNAKVNNINIYMAMPDRYPEELEAMPRKLLRERNILYPIDFDENINRLDRMRIYYKRSKD